MSLLGRKGEKKREVVAVIIVAILMESVKERESKGDVGKEWIDLYSLIFHMTIPF